MFQKFKKKISFLHIPIFWVVIFFLTPLLFIFLISFSKPLLEILPFSKIWNFNNDVLTFTFSLKSYRQIFTDSFYVHSFLSSFFLSVTATFICLFFGFCMAYSITKAKLKYRLSLLLLVVLPFWTSFLIRIYAWMNLLSYKGVLNHFLLKYHFIKAPLQFLDNNMAVILGVTYCYLPFMILPIYAALEKIEKSVYEASYDLGATRFQTLLKVIIPLSKPGIIAGCTMVFLPTLGEFVIPEILGGGSNVMMGRLLYLEFFQHKNWPLACAMAICIIFIGIIPLYLLNHFTQKSPKNMLEKKS